MLQHVRRATTDRIKCGYSALDKRMHESTTGATVREADANQQLVQLSHQIAFVSDWEPSISSGSSSEFKSRCESKHRAAPPTRHRRVLALGPHRAHVVLGAHQCASVFVFECCYCCACNRQCQQPRQSASVCHPYGRAGLSVAHCGVSR